jgi:hypothetical protein
MHTDGPARLADRKRAKVAVIAGIPHCVEEETSNEAHGQRFVYPTSIKGETRLNIKFTSLGIPGMIPQRFGKHECGIPHGLSGSVQLYEQRWKFLVEHCPQIDTTSVLIRWTITNLTSGTVTTALETLQDANVRETCGRTICNNVLKQALETRARELERSVDMILQENPTRGAIVNNLIKVLRPKRCTVGLLFFGLLHEQVQTTWDRAIVSRMLLGSGHN